MTTPELILQQRNIARLFQANLRQQFQSLEALQSAQQREIAAAEQQRLDTSTQFDDLLAKFLELERIARSKLRAVNFDIFKNVGAGTLQTSVEDAARSLPECISEIEHFLSKFAQSEVILVFTDVPSDVDKNAIVECLNKIWSAKRTTCPRTGERLVCTPGLADAIISEMETRGVKAELAV